jgi:hypothetical protein
MMRTRIRIKERISTLISSSLDLEASSLKSTIKAEATCYTKSRKTKKEMAVIKGGGVGQIRKTAKNARVSSRIFALRCGHKGNNRGG